MAAGFMGAVVAFMEVAFMEVVHSTVAEPPFMVVAAISMAAAFTADSVASTGAHTSAAASIKGRAPTASTGRDTTSSVVLARVVAPAAALPFSRRDFGA
jgi:hypothetical protein